MTLKQWEDKVLATPGARERVDAIEDELRLAIGLTVLREQAKLSQHELAECARSVEVVQLTFTFPGGPTVGRIGFGAMRLGDGDGDHDVTVLRRAVELGVTHIDTARMYGGGRNEELVARALAPYPDDLLIATKGGIELSGDSYRHDGRPEALRRHVDESMRRLQVERSGCTTSTIPTLACLWQRASVRSRSFATRARSA
jgi:Aldo/keto reductase family